MAPFLIEIGIKQLQESHPLKETVEWRDISVCFCCCRLKDKIKKKYSERQSLIKAIIDFDDSDSDEEMESERPSLEEKFYIAGYGVKAFFDITSLVIKMFLFMTIVFIPVVYLYTKGETFPNSTVLSTTLGNLGGSHVACEH